mgnify:CR=1 FL=1
MFWRGENGGDKRTTPSEAPISRRQTQEGLNMAHLLPVTLATGAAAYINLDVVRSVVPVSNGPGSHVIFLNGESIDVHEPPKWIYERSLAGSR